MRSKNSFFNKTIFKKNVTLYWPAWVCYLLFLLFVMPGIIWMEMTRYMGDAYTDLDRNRMQYSALNGSLSFTLTPAILFWIAVCMAMAVFNYLNTSRTANAIHALPVNRKELFFTNYLSGLSFMIVPQIITFFVTVLTCLAFQITGIQYLLEWLLAAMGISFFAYSMAVCIEMFTGQTVALPIYFMIANFLYVGLRKLFDMLVIMVCYGVTEYSSLGKSGFLSPLYYLTTQVKVSTLYSDAGMYTDGSGNYGTTVASGIAISGLGLVAIYAVIGVVLVAVAYLLYQRRKIEAAGDLITIGIVKPIFRWGVAICCGFGAAMIVVAILREYDLAQSTAALYLAVVVFGAIFFFLAQMLLDKSFHVFQKPFLRECAVMVVVSVAALGVIDADLFGIESYVPDYDNIEAAFVYMDYPLQIADEDMEEFLALHSEVISHCDEFSRLSHEPSGYYYTTFCYYLKNGSKVTRQYAIPLAEDVADGSIAGTILSWETDPSNVKKNLLGTYWEENEYLSMSLDLVNDEGDSYDRFFSDEEMARMLDAVMQDIEDGNFACTYLEREQEASESYYNSIRYTYQNPYYYNDQWYYYDDYFESMQENDTAVMRNDSTSTNYISFSPSCTHIIETLEDMGISADEAWDGEWSLKTYTQMEEIWETS